MCLYALNCRPGQEKDLIRSCRQRLSREALNDAFQFSYERMKKYLGEWHLDTYVMFPNYVFLESGDPERLSEELEQYRTFVDVLESDGILLPIQAEEERAFDALCGECHHLGMSRGVIEDGMVRIFEGPLAGRESMIRKVERHKRVAVLDLQLTSGAPYIWAGLEITGKN